MRDEEKEINEKNLEGDYLDELPPSTEGQGEEEEGEGKKKDSGFETLLAKKGFKSPEELAKAYEELEKKLTSVGMLLSEKTKELESRRFQAPGKSFEEEGSREDDIILPTKKAIKQSIREVIGEWQMQLAQREIERLRRKNPEEFERLRPYMYELSLRYPDADLHELYEGAKVLETKRMEDMRKQVLGNITPEDLMRLKESMNNIKRATLGEGSSGTEIEKEKKPSSEEEKLLKEIFG